jgi:hypothetical protein
MRATAAIYARVDGYDRRKQHPSGALERMRFVEVATVPVSDECLFGYARYYPERDVFTLENVRSCNAFDFPHGDGLGHCPGNGLGSTNGCVDGFQLSLGLLRNDSRLEWIQRNTAIH